jgi:hypothetical protein
MSILKADSTRLAAYLFVEFEGKHLEIRALKKTLLGLADERNKLGV